MVLETKKLIADRERTEKLNDFQMPPISPVSQLQVHRRNPRCCTPYEVVPNIASVSCRPRLLNFCLSFQNRCAYDPMRPCAFSLSLSVQVPVPHFEGWVKKKGRGTLEMWKWRSVVLLHHAVPF